MKTKLLLIVAAFAGSFFLAEHFDRNSLYLPKQVTQGLRWVESFFLDVPKLEIRTIESLEDKTVIPEPSVKLADDEEQNYSHVEVGNRHVCIDTSIGELKYKKVGDIYTWTDENDVYHVSDKAPEDGQFKLFNYADEKVFDYFSLDLNTENLSYDFNEKLTVKLNSLFKMYGSLLDVSSLKKVDIKLRIYASKLGFNEVKAKNNMPINDNTPGFYSHATNQAHLLLTHHAATMRTATHEATHAINRGIIGYSPRWLNEGLAEYSEYIEVKGMNAHVYPNKDWTRNGRMSEKLLPLNTLFTANDNLWHSSQRQRLYATSWAFIYFMMETPHRKSMLAKIIRSEQKNICDVINDKSSEMEIGLSMNILQKQFSGWSKSKLRSQSI